MAAGASASRCRARPGAYNSGEEAEAARCCRSPCPVPATEVHPVMSVLRDLRWAALVAFCLLPVVGCGTSATTASGGKGTEGSKENKDTKDGRDNKGTE